MLVGNNRSYNYVNDEGVPTVVGSWGQTGEDIGGLFGSVLGGLGGSAVAERFPAWWRHTGQYGDYLGANGGVRAGASDLERGMLYGRRQPGYNGYGQGEIGPYMSKTGMRELNGRFAAGENVLRSNYWSNPMNTYKGKAVGKGSEFLGRNIGPKQWYTPSGEYAPFGYFALPGKDAEGADNPTIMPDFRYKSYTPVEEPPVEAPIPTRSAQPTRPTMEGIPVMEAPTDELNMPENGISVGGPIDDPSIRDLRNRNRNMRSGSRGIEDNPETENNERADARDLTRKENSFRRQQIREKRSKIRDLRRSRNSMIDNGRNMESHGVNTDYRDKADDVTREIRRIRGRR